MEHQQQTLTHSDGLRIQHVETSQIVHPGAIFFENYSSWIEEGLDADTMIAKVREQCGGHLSEQDMANLYSWAVAQQAGKTAVINLVDTYIDPSEAKE